MSISDPFDDQAVKLSTAIFNHEKKPQKNYEGSEIELTQEETQIFKLLQDCLAHNNLEGEVKFFATGGWLRDKILHRSRGNQMHLSFHSERADINSSSISNMIKEFERYQNGDIFSHEKYDEVHHVNASKLKHIDISAFDLKGQHINMQQILENSSHQRFADKEENFKLDLAEDAMNRDFTMNALYFDLDELKVVDPLGRGLEDIENKLVELCSEFSFVNDPLRILRAVRMSTQFNFKISSQIQEQIETELMQPVFDSMVSKQRIGSELDKIFCDRKTGLHAIELMTDLGIIDNYIVEICNEHKTKDSVKIPDNCILKDTFKQDALILARLLDQSLPESTSNEDFKHIYYLCMFKVFEDEPDLLHQALIEIGASKKTKKFVENSLHLYTHFMEGDQDLVAHGLDQKRLVDASDKTHGFLPIFAAVESYINDQV